MTKLRVLSFGVSLDGYGAGPNQNLEHPLGVGGAALLMNLQHAAFPMSALGSWAATCSARSEENVPTKTGKVGGATIRRFTSPVFVLSHHPRASIMMAGGTSFQFRHGRHRNRTAKGRGIGQRQDVRLGGGVATIQQYLRARLIDEMHFAITPTLLGSGEQLFAGLDAVALVYLQRACSHRQSDACQLTRKS